MNKLSREKSPYLLQHKDNPVWWQPWGDEAFAMAVRENKPIFLSVGYSTCHWCHVMEKDSFETNEVAAVLNKNFVCVKVDREEKPDVDSLYMNAVQAMSGRGGWPMTVLMTPSGKPFWGGTFLPRENLIQLLHKITEVWTTSPEALHETGEKLFDYLTNQLNLSLEPSSKEVESRAVNELPLIQFARHFETRFDATHGGYSGAPKFPPALALATLLRLEKRAPAENLKNMIVKTLDEMRRGGIYDQIGGGFHRYSTDNHWLVPHFEKMLYDNALLATVYFESYQLLKNNEHCQVGIEILEYVLREMQSPEGGFYSAEDADSEGIEGKYYVWSTGELKNILTELEFEYGKNFLNFTSVGNFEAHLTSEEVSPNKNFKEPALHSANIFYQKSETPLPQTQDEVFRAIKTKLMAVRSRRIRPSLDDKILVSWNGLMISAFAKGYQITHDKKYLEAASNALNFILEKVTSETGELFRRYRDGEKAHAAQADDYAFIIQACLEMYHSDFDPKWYFKAIELQETMDKKFWDEIEKGYFDNDGTDLNLFTRTKTFEDGVTPSANSVAALNLLKLSSLAGSLSYKKKAEEIINRADVLIKKYPQASPYLLQSVDRLTDKQSELAIIGALRKPKPAETAGAETDTGTDLANFLQKWRKEFLPNKTLAVSLNGEVSEIPLLKNRPALHKKLTFYLCESGACQLPTHSSDEAFSQGSTIRLFGP